MAEEKYYTVNDVARMLQVTRTTVYDWMRSGSLPYVIAGGRRRITASALQAFIRAGNPQQDDNLEDNLIESRTPSLAGALP